RLVEELAQVIAPRVAADGDDELVWPEPPRVPQRRGYVGARGAAEQHALVAGDVAGDLEALGVAHAQPLVHDLAVERLGHVVLADALDLPRLAAAAGEDRPVGVGADDLDVGVLFLEVPADTRDRAAGADAGNEHGDPPVGLLPDF